MTGSLELDRRQLSHPSLRVRSLALRDFRGIESLDLEFADPDGKTLDLIVLGGPNGCGKTAVIEACLLALGRKDLLAFREKAGPDTRIGASQYSIDATIECDERPHTVRVREREGRAQDQALPSRHRSDLWKGRPISYFTCWRGPILKVHLVMGTCPKWPRDLRAGQGAPL